MTNSKNTIDVWVVVNESGAFVVADNEDIAAELADQEFGEDEDVRSVRLKIKISPANGTQAPAEFELELD